VFFADFSRTLEAIRCHLTSLDEELISIRQRSNENRKGHFETISDAKPGGYKNINFQKFARL
jgi:hypothetical protein